MKFRIYRSCHRNISTQFSEVSFIEFQERTYENIDITRAENPIIFEKDFSDLTSRPLINIFLLVHPLLRLTQKFQSERERTIVSRSMYVAVKQFWILRDECGWSNSPRKNPTGNARGGRSWPTCRMCPRGICGNFSSFYRPELRFSFKLFFAILNDTTTISYF